MLVYRYPNKIKADPRRIILQFFELGEKRTRKILKRIAAVTENDVSDLLQKILNEFDFRHNNLKQLLLENYKKVNKYINDEAKLSSERKLLIGAYFSKEYSIEAAALFNPSIVLHPDQSRLKEGQIRFILSLRAAGEGHISSIEFRTGVLGKNNDIQLEPVRNYTELPKIVDNIIYTREEIRTALKFVDDADEKLSALLPEKFTKKQLFEILPQIKKDLPDNSKTSKTINGILSFVDANYKFTFSENGNLFQRVIFPMSKTESVGMEDLRLVKFKNDDNSFTYYGTYSAYNGHEVKVQLLETKDFINFSVRTLQGKAIQDKGMALFPRKINGKYIMISRQGGEEIGIMSSNDLYVWNDYKLLESPNEPWQFVQLGNCGSPIETKEGWLLITHTVGAFRKYVISASLLDLDNPAKIVARLNEPLISPDESEREGYVPNVVYSCGYLKHGDIVIIPYAMSDSMSGFAQVSINELLNKMR